MRKKYGMQDTGKKLHKRRMDSWSRNWSKCGSAFIHHKYDDLSRFFQSELCKKCFPEEWKKEKDFQNSFLLDEELFTI